MPSIAFQAWRSRRARELDQIEAARAALGESARGRRRASEQIDHAYAVLLSSQFQGFCRDLHSESATLLAESVRPVALRSVLRAELLSGRRLDRGNANPANIESDFNRLGVVFWRRVEAEDRRTPSRRRSLEHLNTWRNAIAHQDFEAPALAPARLRLSTVRQWRRACDGLARAFDRALERYLRSVLGTAPW